MTIKLPKYPNFEKNSTAESIAIATSVLELACTESSGVVEFLIRMILMIFTGNISKIDTSPLDANISKTARPKNFKFGTLFGPNFWSIVLKFERNRFSMRKVISDHVWCT